MYILSAECPEFRNIEDPNVKVAILSRQVNGKVIFECPRGYQKAGAPEAYCQVNGQWSQPAPSCQGENPEGQSSQLVRYRCRLCPMRMGRDSYSPVVAIAVQWSGTGHRPIS